MDRIWLKHYPAGVPTDIDPDRYASLTEMFDQACAAYGNLPAYTNMGATLSFAQLDELSRAFAAWLQHKSGLAAGDRVALMMPNILQYPIALFGVLRAGMVVVNTNPLYTARELEHQLKDSGAKAIVVVENFAHVVQQVLPHTGLKSVLVTRIGDLLGFPRGALVNFVLRHVRKQIPAWNMPGAVTFKSALGAGLGLKLDPVALGPQDIAFLQYTGGTTGVAKAAILTHRNMVANVLQASAWIRPALQANTGPNASRIVITALPLYHIFSLTANCLLFLRLGAHNILITNPRDFPGFVAELKKYKFFFISGVNTLFNALLHTPGFEIGGLQRLAHHARRRHGRAGGGGRALEKGHGQRTHAGLGTDRDGAGRLHQSDRASISTARSACPFPRPISRFATTTARKWRPMAWGRFASSDRN